MCEACFNPSRRQLLAGVFRSDPVGRRSATVVADGLAVEKRASWAGDGRPSGLLVPESDVRVLLVHHSASPNDYEAADVPGILQGFWAFHTGPEKGWPDIAYNFLIDRYGTVWEGRSGSLDGQIRGDATGGNQGYSQLVCLIGNFETELPSVEARTSLERLLVWMADRAGIDPAPGSRTSFRSLGSNRHPAGTEIDTATITGHRTMSLTSCPGDAFAPLVETEVALAVAARSATATAETTTTTAATSTTESPTSSASSSVSAGSLVAASPSSTAAGSEAAALTTGSGRGVIGGLALAAGAVGVAVGGLVALRRRAGPTDAAR